MTQQQPDGELIPDDAESGHTQLSAPEPGGDEPGRPRTALIAGIVVAALVLGGVGVLGWRTLQNRSATGTVVGTAGAPTIDKSAEPSSPASTATTPAPSPPAAAAPSGAAPQPSATATGAAPSGTSAAAPAPANAGRTIDAYDISVGECIGDPGANPTVQTLVVVPCSQAHYGEVFAQFALPGDDSAPYPGDTTVEADAMKGCDDRFTDFVGVHRSESKLDFAFLTPTESTWGAKDRAVTCLVYDPQSSTTGSLKNSRR